MAITLSNRGVITERPMVAVLSMAAAAATSTDMVPPIVMRDKHRPAPHPRRGTGRHSRRCPASGDGFGMGITGFAPASEDGRRYTYSSVMGKIEIKNRLEISALENRHLDFH